MRICSYPGMSRCSSVHLDTKEAFPFVALALERLSRVLAALVLTPPRSFKAVCL